MRTLLPLALLLLAAQASAEPRAKRPTDEERGKELYARHCESCHGAFNGGHGPATRALVHPVPNLVGKVVVDDASTEVVLLGKSAMPAYEQSFDRFDARRVLEYMATLSPPDPAAQPTEDAPAEEKPAEPTEPPAVEDDENGPE